MDTLLNGIIYGITTGAVYAVIALGLAIIYNVSGILNFAHGHLVVLAMYFGVIVEELWGIDPYLASIIVVPLMAMIGVILYLFVFRKLIGVHVLMSVQATLGIMFLLQGILLITQGGQYKRVHSPIEDNIVHIGATTLSASTLVALIVGLIASVVLFWVLGRTRYGRNVRAVLQNPRGAELVGVNIVRVRVITFALSLAFAAIAGILLLPGQAVHPSLGLEYTVVAVLAFFIGGPKNLFGTFVGGLILGVADSLGAIYMPGHFGFIVPYVVVIIVILFRPQGLFTSTKTVKI